MSYTVTVELTSCSSRKLSSSRRKHFSCSTRFEYELATGRNHAHWTIGLFTTTRERILPSGSPSALGMFAAKSVQPPLTSIWCLALSFNNKRLMAVDHVNSFLSSTVLPLRYMTSSVQRLSPTKHTVHWRWRMIWVLSWADWFIFVYDTFFNRILNSDKLVLQPFWS